MNRKKREKHGLSGTRLENIWHKMHGRCYNPKHANFKFYGARGISVCEKWNSIKAFGDWANSNGYSENLQIDRIDNDGNYEPSNCKWSTPKDQCNNTRRNVLFKWRGALKTLRQIARDESISYFPLFYAVRSSPRKYSLSVAVQRLKLKTKRMLKRIDFAQP